MSRETGDCDQQLISISVLHSAWGVLGLIMLVSLVLLWPSWVTLSDIWLHWSDYSHGYLVAIICLGLIFRQRTYLQTRRCEPFIWGLVPLIIFEFVWLIARLAYLEIVELLLLPLIVWTVCLTVMGWSSSRKLQFPFFFLYFAIPIWHSGNFMLQQITVEVVDYMITLAGFPAYIEGNFVYLATGTFEIADGCSGLHYFVAAITVAALYGYLDFRYLRHRILLVLMFAIVSMIGNWIRVFAVIYAGYATDMQHFLVTVDHYYFGWVLFTILLLPVLLISRRFNRESINAPDESMDAVLTDNASSENKRYMIQALMLATIFMVLTTLLSVIKMRPLEPVDVRIEPPAGGQNWIMVEDSRPDWHPLFIGTEDELIKDYSDGSNLITLYINLYTEQSQGQELIGFDNRIEGDGIWKINKSSGKTIELMQDKKWEVRKLLLKERNNKHRLVYYWYEIGGHRVVTDLPAKIWQGVSRLVGEYNAGLIAISAECIQDRCEVAQENLNSWLNDIWVGGQQGIKYSQN